MKNWTDDPVIGDIPRARFSDDAMTGINQELLRLEVENGELQQEVKRLARVAKATAQALDEERKIVHRKERDIARLDKRLLAADGAMQNLSAQIVALRLATPENLKVAASLMGQRHALPPFEEDEIMLGTKCHVCPRTLQVGEGDWHKCSQCHQSYCPDHLHFLTERSKGDERPVCGSCLHPDLN